MFPRLFPNQLYRCFYSFSLKASTCFSNHFTVLPTFQKHASHVWKARFPLFRKVVWNQLPKRVSHLLPSFPATMFLRSVFKIRDESRETSEMGLQSHGWVPTRPNSGNKRDSFSISYRIFLGNDNLVQGLLYNIILP